MPPGHADRAPRADRADPSRPGLHVASTGSGPPVVLVHGFTQTGRSWGPVGDALVAAGHRVVTVDAPGHGGSAEVRVDLEGGADLLAAAAGQAAYVGYSMGGRLCLHLAVARPKLVERLVLISATAGIDDPSERAARRQADEAMAAGLEAGGDEQLAAFVDRWLAGPLFDGLPAAASGRTERLTNTARGLASSLRLSGTGAMTPLWDRLAELAMPVLVIAGGSDDKFSAIGRRMVAAIGTNARLHLIERANHAAHLEAPAAVAEAIVAFLA